jgi:hypothetical protein
MRFFVPSGLRGGVWARTLPGFFLVALVIGAIGCGARRPAPPSEPFAHQEVIDDLQEFARGLGIASTGNFQRYAGAPRALFRCYFTGKLELPASYEQLKMVETGEPACAVDDQMYDVFFYPIEAVATGVSPVTPSLSEAPLERVLMVVPHEDFHNQREARRAAPDIAEAGATLIGFLTASEFAKAKYGADSGLFRRLDGEARLFVDKARIVNAFFDELAALYAAFRSATITREAALAAKARLFAALERECTGLVPASASFNRCPAVLNNAGLSFDRTYTRFYPLLYELHTSQRDARASVAALKRLLASGPQSEAELLERLASIQVE